MLNEEVAKVIGENVRRYRKEKGYTQERLAEEAEREVDDLKKAEYMMDRIGEEFEGIISSVTSFGIFVELPNTVEGLVHINDLDFFIGA